MNNRIHTSASKRNEGSTLIIVLTTLAILAAVCGLALSRLGSSHQTAFRGATWNATISSAESGVDFAMDRLRVAIKNRGTWTNDTNALTASDASTWAGWTLTTTNGVVSRTYASTNTMLTTSGEGENRVMAQITVDAPASLQDASGSQWYRIRSRGVANLGGGARVNDEKLDNSLFVANLQTTGQTSRLIEAIAKPRSAFKYAFLTDYNMSINGSSGITDSYDSRDNTKSTNGAYDAAKRQTNGNIASNHSIGVGGYLWGSAAANGMMPGPAVHIYGERRDDFYEELPPVIKPTWTVYAASPSTVTAATTITAGAVTPTRFKLGQIGGPLRIAAPTAGQASTAEIWVTGNITSSITSDPGVTVRIWFEGNINLSRDSISNSGKAVNTQLYGVTPLDGTARTIFVKPSANFIASIYAPAHDLDMQGNADFFGSFVLKTVASNGGVSMHYDEALQDDTAFIKGFSVASWLEDSR